MVATAARPAHIVAELAGRASAVLLLDAGPAGSARDLAVLPREHPGLRVVALGVTAVLLNGCLTDCCVLNTAFDASNIGYRVTVVSDLTRGTTAEMEDAALRIVALHLGLVADARMTLANLYDGASASA